MSSYIDPSYWTGNDEPTTTTQTRTLIEVKKHNSWDVRYPARSDSLKANMTPKIFKTTGRKRRFILETHVYSFSSAQDGHNKNDNDAKIESVHLRLQKRYLVKKKTLMDTVNESSPAKASKAVVSNASKASKAVVSCASKAVKREKEVDSDSDDESSIVSSTSSMMTKSTNRGTGGSYWVDKYFLDLLDIEIGEVRDKKVFIRIRKEGEHQTREVTFKSRQDAQSFAEEINNQIQLEITRRRDNLVSATCGMGITNYDEFAKEELEYLIEIVGAEDLHACDKNGSSDPYVEVLFNDESIHRTRVVKRQLNPIWTFRTGAYFFFKTTAEELFNEDEGLIFLVYDNDVGKDDLLGCASLLPRVLYKAKEEDRIVLDLHEFGAGTTEVEGYNEGKIAIRARQATYHDREFMMKAADDLKNGKFFNKENTSAHSKGLKPLKYLLENRVQKKKIGDEIVELHRIRPYPDEARKKETEWMTSNEIDEEYMKPSQKWVDTGSGTLGKVFLEILSCTDLPNKDNGIFGNVTDPYVRVIYEDTKRRTDVISDCMSPKWMPWTNRAFILHMSHPSSQISLGVVDFDNGLVSHDFIAKVTVDLTHLRPGTEYVLDYKLFDSFTHSERNEDGKIKIRLCLEINDPQQMLLTTLTPPEQVYVNVSKKQDWKTIRKTIYGERPLEEYKFQNIMSLIEELMSYYYDSMEYIIGGLEHMILWRNHYALTIIVPWFHMNAPRRSGRRRANNSSIFGDDMLNQYTKRVTIPLPLNSMVAFIYLTTLIEDFSLFPSYFFFLLGWLLIGVMDWRSNHVNPWVRCQSFLECLQVLITGKDMTPAAEIAPDETELKVIEDYNNFWKERIDAAEQRRTKEAAEALADQQQLAQELEEIGANENTLQTEKEQKGFGLSPMTIAKPYLYPIQQYLIYTCRICRFVRNVVIWEEKYFSFWFTLACFSISLLFFFVPWAFLMTWSLRLLVWSAFGPWMKLVDFYYIKNCGMTEEELKDSIRKAREARNKALEDLVNNARIKREDELKLKAFKQYLFGRFMSSVPILKNDRFIERPLLTSRATPLEKAQMQSSTELVVQEEEEENVEKRFDGQQLTGRLIPTLKDNLDDTLIGQPTALGGLVMENPFTELDTGKLIYYKMVLTLFAAAMSTEFLFRLITKQHGSPVKVVEQQHEVPVAAPIHSRSWPSSFEISISILLIFIVIDNAMRLAPIEFQRKFHQKSKSEDKDN